MSCSPTRPLPVQGEIEALTAKAPRSRDAPGVWPQSEGQTLLRARIEALAALDPGPPLDRLNGTAISEQEQILCRLRERDPAQLDQDVGLFDIARGPMNGRVTGALQFEVLASRIELEYGLPVRFEASQFTSARWVSGPKAELDRFIAANKQHIAHDNDGDPVYLTRLKWDIDRAERDYPELTLAATKEMHGA